MSKNLARPISIINQSTLLTDEEVEQVVPALQRQISHDFYPVWGVDTELSFVPHGKRASKKTWWLVLMDNSDESGFLGYHDMTDEGHPMGKVFVKSDMDAGTSWTNTLSHELIEMLGDPDLTLCAFVHRPNHGMYLYAYELCDPCEADRYGYKIDGTLVSDFIYPSWYETFWQRGETEFDHRGHIKQPLEILPDGYMSVLHVTHGGIWHDIGAQHAPCHYSGRARLGSRRERRRIPRDQWLKSTPRPRRSPR